VAPAEAIAVCGFAFVTASLPLTFMTAPERVYKGQSSQPVALASRWLVSLGCTRQATACWRAAATYCGNTRS